MDNDDLDPKPENVTTAQTVKRFVVALVIVLGGVILGFFITFPHERSGPKYAPTRIGLEAPPTMGLTNTNTVPGESIVPPTP